MNIFSRVIIFTLFILIQPAVLAEQTVANQAPDFSLSTEFGEVISLSDYKGKPLVLHFWATWCPYCKKLQPGLDELYLKYQKQGLEMVAISFWEDDGASPQAELLKRGMHFTTLVNGDNVAKQYRVKGTPSTFFINRAGEVLWKTSNSDPNNPKLEQAIQSIITSVK
ncbi:MAG: TlpA family protein disulfide reductase [Colwellia sp.]|nr:TlpA family protein disulfide reductase [Colwellia sp.]